MTQKSIYDLELHEQLTLCDGEVKVVKVAGGWLYHFGGNDNGVFVPYNSEFQLYSEE